MSLHIDEMPQKLKFCLYLFPCGKIVSLCVVLLNASESIEGMKMSSEFLLDSCLISIRFLCWVDWQKKQVKGPLFQALGFKGPCSLFFVYHASSLSVTKNQKNIPTWIPHSPLDHPPGTETGESAQTTWHLLPEPVFSPPWELIVMNGCVEGCEENI